MTNGPLQLPGPPSATWRTDLEPDALPPTPELTGGQRRVLAAAMGLFATKGFVASTTRDIAAELGMQAPSLYNHFASKDAILERLVLFGWAHAHSELLSALVHAGSSPTAQLEALVRTHVLMSCEFPRLTLVIGTETAHLAPEPLAIVRNHRQATRDLLAQVLRRGHDEGSFHIAHLRTTMWTLAAMGQSAAVQYPYQPEIHAAEFAEEFVALALRVAGVAATLSSSAGSDAAVDAQAG
ncbi:MAG: TetR family transcriptional regulator [Actinobacteria bacterium]|uniref:Unannotated protein n=1 Tax=freshwater metagenome TaxID=449393 RepID=A0A6J6NSM9_9ZZZZ|nr:TetR family transcriptional regulator [Actinomycetota bacterium]